MKIENVISKWSDVMRANGDYKIEIFGALRIDEPVKIKADLAECGYVPAAKWETLNGQRFAMVWKFSATALAEREQYYRDMDAMMGAANA